jgi:hypothetical protein
MPNHQSKQAKSSNCRGKDPQSRRTIATARLIKDGISGQVQKSTATARTSAGFSINHAK